MKYTIFSIDSANDLHTLAKFTRRLDEKRALGKLHGNVVMCVGSYKGQLEHSFLMLTRDYFEFVEQSGYVDNQESVLRVSECNKQYADLLFHDGTTVSIGSLKSVGQDEAFKHDAWTYRPDLNTYWIAVDGNPDTVNEG